MTGTDHPSRRTLWGRGLLTGGTVLLSIGIGVGLGYWSAELELRWLPKVVPSILLIWVAGFLLLAAGAQLRSGFGPECRLRPRAVVSACLALLSAGAMAAIFFATAATPLTEMTEAEFRYVNQLDARYFRELDRSLQGVVALLGEQSELFRSDPPRALTPEEESLLLDAWCSYLNAALAMDQIRRFYEDFYRVDISRRDRWRHTSSYLLTFTAELSLYENTARTIEILDGNPNAIRFLNVARPELSMPGDSVAWAQEDLAGLTDLGRVAAGKRYLSFLDRVHQARTEAIAAGSGWLWEETDRYIAAVEKRRRRDMAMLSAASDFAPILCELKHLVFPVQKEAAEWMGDFRIKRVGKYLITREQARAMETELQSGDVLLSRKNWYLSNIGLPGFWPHAMIYVGSNDRIAQTFDADPEVGEWVADRSGQNLVFSQYLQKKYPIAWRKSALSGSSGSPLSVIEAVSEGVIQNSAYGAAGDFLVSLRPRVSLVAKARAIDRAFSYLDLPYDFDFDFATDQTLVCTEVVWRSYRSAGGLRGLNLRPVKVAGRLTLPANLLASRFKAEYGKAEAQFDFVSYLEGREKEGIAVVAGVESFLETPDRSKWDFGPL